MSIISRPLDNTDLSIETCILQLVKIAIRKRASAIAVRFDSKKRKIQVVDNGNGYTKSELTSIFDKKDENSFEREEILEKIRCISYAVVITSRHKYSPCTYVKVANQEKHKLIQGYSRPSKGTTVSVYDYNSSNWMEDDKNHSISYVLAALAFTELEVSFSLRNDDEDKIIFEVGKPHNPWTVFKQMKAIQDSDQVFQSVSRLIKNREIDCNTENDGTNRKVSSTDLLGKSSAIHSCAENHSIHYKNVCSPLSVWSDWSYNPKKSNINQNVNVDSNIFFSSNEQIDVSNDAFINLSQLSVWSDWSYYPEKDQFHDTSRDVCNKFLPSSIYRKLCYNNLQILKNNNYSLLSQYQLHCDESKCIIKFDECRISSNTINSLQIIKQVNKEFIVAIANENGKKLLILIDQHAIHERIRYEWLIETYREKQSLNYLSEKLGKDLLISNIDKNLLQCIILHKKILRRVGIHVKESVGSNACIVDAVPRCFLKRLRSYNDEYNLRRLMKNVKQLLLEVAKGLSHNILPPILPITINNIIASEACHGAIKFGDPLNIKECTLLVQALQETKAPTRCAHGRPSIIPLINLKDLENQKFRLNKKLNFASLKQ